MLNEDGRGVNIYRLKVHGSSKTKSVILQNTLRSGL